MIIPGRARIGIRGESGKDSKVPFPNVKTKVPPTVLSSYDGAESGSLPSPAGEDPEGCPCFAAGMALCNRRARVLRKVRRPYSRVCAIQKCARCHRA